MCEVEFTNAVFIDNFEHIQNTGQFFFQYSLPISAGNIGRIKRECWLKIG